MSNKYIQAIMEKGSANDALTAHRNLALAQGRGGDAIMMHHAKGMQLKGLPKSPSEMTEEERQAILAKGCFTANTMIQTPDGEKEISRIKKGDKIISYEDGKKTVEFVKSTITYPPSIVWDFELSNGTVVSSTEHHTMLTTDGWMKFGDIVVGTTKLVLINEKNSVTVLHKSNSRRELVYNLKTTGSHNFIANGLVAHNYTFARKFRSILSTLSEKLSVIDSHKPLEVSF